jgi:hypothetical protein
MYNPDTIEILSGLNLYHVTPKNVEENYDDYPFLEGLAKTERYTYDTNNHMFFGFTEFFTNYYATSEYLTQKLMFETVTPLKLVFFTKEKPATYDPDIFQTLLQLGYDGFVAQDDMNDNWLEICIFEPNKHVKFVKEINTKYVPVTCNYPPYVDIATLNTYIISRETNHSLVVEKEDYHWNLYSN